jgi:hypothetical protein
MNWLHNLASIERNLRKRLAALGLHVERHHDFEQLRDTVAAAVTTPFNPTFNPDLSDIDPQSWWLAARDGAGDIVATHAVRVFRDKDLEVLIWNGLLFFRREDRPLNWYEIAPRHQPTKNRVQGTWSHAGATWVRKDWRGRGLTSLLPILDQIDCLRDPSIGHVTGIAFQEIAGRSILEKGYGFPPERAEKILDGHFPGTGRKEELWLCHMPREMAIGHLTSVFRAVIENVRDGDDVSDLSRTVGDG